MLRLKTPKQAFLWILLGDVFAVGLAVFLAFLFRFDGTIPSQYLEGGFQGTLGIILAATLASFWLFRLYSFSWEHIGITEILSLGRALLVSALFAGVAFLLFQDLPVFAELPRSVFLIGYMLIFFFSSGVRLAKRVWREELKNHEQYATSVLIVGAGDAGAELLRNILASSPRHYAPIGLVDDDPVKQGTMLHGVRVLGFLENIPDLVASLNVEGLIIALPSAGSNLIRFAVEQGRRAGLKQIKIVPPLTELLRGEVNLQQLREVRVEDLLGRKPFSLEPAAIEAFLSSKSILITGAAGSIGSELARQALRFAPTRLVLVDQDESGIFMVVDELKRQGFTAEMTAVVADIRNSERVGRLFQEFQPQVVFHAAAYKHVSLMEQYPEEAVRTNVLGTGVVANAALKAGTEVFVYVSTDKAVNPTSVMGATKRIGEMVCQLSQREGKTRFVAVRFGNVLDSRGSVIPLFREQLKRGGPLEVTHPDMQRYFMVNSEACLLVMQAGAVGNGGEVFVLDMGKPVKILDLAHEMVRLSGLEPDKDVPIVFSGRGPGEKLFEEFLSAEEGILETSYQRIFIAKLPPVEERVLLEGLEKLKHTCQQGDRERIHTLLGELVPSYAKS